MNKMAPMVYELKLTQQQAAQLWKGLMKLTGEEGFEVQMAVRMAFEQQEFEYNTAAQMELQRANQPSTPLVPAP
jgi:hypothetical protein